ncbi:MAG: nucleotidyltransferase domain-containing protein [Candidatus Omnitrophica bacterium]|nr:nucleotidyltransferase domain-containing protein [Candidatus Omnitrophota bacterium]MBU1127620.1 nucleotidyltransferase domain-containing protein [Candidatus Omnitrophota bacterium]MBU1784570.1 nucleotidyltransferase domain-containing protein [Candidatus Omnitrophota bacterium]MBU1850851.1 nucleotidyltransferase domain-containing protein [Candidatus Omnitrophota bacterium]
MNINKKTIDEIVKVILSYKPLERIVIFGSRASGTNSRISDIDIAIFAEQWNDKDINVVKNALDETVKTPLKFDILNYYAVSKEKLKKNIIKKGKVIYDSRKDK